MASPVKIPTAIESSSMMPIAGSDNAHRPHHGHSSDARERPRTSQSFTGWACDGEGTEALSPCAETGDVGSVRNENRTVHFPSHAGDGVDVRRVDRGRMPEAVLGSD